MHGSCASVARPNNLQQFSVGQDCCRDIVQQCLKSSCHVITITRLVHSRCCCCAYLPLLLLLLLLPLLLLLLLLPGDPPFI